ncbi:hypothetical protein F5Y13DRAFT_186346 [Hypoxylon sp. FL1857]|nr:hypothetical protein F5Y13DRAFT_186346 [Hypoxylon sp. FL1857]
MKLPIFIFVASAVSGVIADFWLVYLNYNKLGGPLIAGPNYAEGGAFLKSPELNNCNVNIGPYNIWGNTDDVSGDKTGMRTVPGKTVPPPMYRDPLDIVEFNTGNQKPGHHTIYKDRNYTMVDVNGKVTGQCVLDRAYLVNLNCPWDDTTVKLIGSSMFYCVSDIELD